MSHVALDLGDHHDVELVADLADKPRHVVEKPRGVQRIDARPEAGRAEVRRLRHRDQAVARGGLGFDRDRVLEIAEHDVDLPSQLAGLGAHLFDVRRHEMDHALEPRRQFPVRTRRADRQRLEDLARGFHERALAQTPDLRDFTREPASERNRVDASNRVTAPLRSPHSSIIRAIDVCLASAAAVRRAISSRWRRINGSVPASPNSVGKRRQLPADLLEDRNLALRPGEVVAQPVQCASQVPHRPTSRSDD